MLSITERLVRKFGLGKNPPIRRRFYARLEAAFDRHGDCVLTLISEAVLAASRAKQDRARLFCRTASARLAELESRLDAKAAEW